MTSVGNVADKTAMMGWLFENSPDLMFVSGPDGCFKLVNPAWARETGWDEADLIGQPVLTFYHPEDIPTVSARIVEARTGVITEGDVRVRLKAGGWRWYAARRQITDDGVHIVTLRDIAEARARATELEEARRTRQLLSVAAGIGAWRYDAVERRIHFSRELLALTGYAAEDIEAPDRFAVRIHPADRTGARAILSRAVKTGVGGEMEYRLKIGRRWRRLRTTFRSEPTPEGTYSLHGISEDITELASARDAARRGERQMRKAQSAAEAATEAKSSFLANMSHEIRTPMNGVLGILHLLKSEALSAEGRRMLEEALSCGDMLAELVNDVVDFSRIEAGQLALACEPLDPAALVGGVVHILKPQADAKGLALTVEVDPELGWVSSDPVRLRQALFNLVGNAVKFTQRGSVTLRCAAPAPGRLRFEVVDTGVGIPLHAQGGLFRRFDQGDSSTTRKFGGSGLGLAITRRLAEMMGGAVGFASRPGAGSTFWLEVAAEPAEAPAAVTGAGAVLFPGARVLVVEDNATNRMIAGKLLESFGCAVESAADGHQGVEAARIGAFDIILMDVQMPGIDGVEATRRIRALPGPVGRTPILALTANVLAHQRQAYLEAGMDGVVGKPISPARLLAELSRLIGTAVADQRSNAA